MQQHTVKDALIHLDSSIWIVDIFQILYISKDIIEYQWNGTQV